MTAIDELVAYIGSLTPEQLEKAISFLPQVISAIAEQERPDRQKEFSQTA
jgi:predicted RNA-binding protein associated with RNAse of E/G family